MEQAVLYETRQNAALITLNRPERRNSINQALLAGLYEGLEKAQKDDSVRAVVLTGNGKSFCAGIDLSVIGTDNLFDPRGDGVDLPEAFAACKKPVIGAVNGHAITGGFEIALQCDFLIASDQASFADTHLKVGIHPGWGMTQLLRQAVGVRMAKQISLTAQFVPAAEALRIGLVNEVVSAEQLVPRALEIAGQIAALNQGLLPQVKTLIEFQDSATFEASLAQERREFRRFVDMFIRK
jgi:enoyl-CoA hydratase